MEIFYFRTGGKIAFFVRMMCGKLAKMSAEIYLPEARDVEKIDEM